MSAPRPKPAMKLGPAAMTAGYALLRPLAAEDAREQARRALQTSMDIRQ